MGLDSQELQTENTALKATIKELRDRIEELEKLADSDTLTPLPNRRFFLRELERVAKQVARYGTPAALLFVDVDGLKAINDAHGHGAGDDALIHVARLLRDQVRGGDIVARIGGDEFGLLLDRADEAAAREKAAALCALVARSPAPGAIAVTISIGIAALCGEDDHHSLLARADGAMYAAKRAQPRSDR
ncbi:MAG: hypothetical protein ABS87_02540 [Sphingomonas sp. SCN 67-18]|uniref:GGDEF domain-containing protein n=1 Tax=uncultured Sphingomonas sp. TaxID=158754 RepID=UPI00086CB3D8|nr:GGDEF domain-containing protein [Sphingomonas sp. SCN 67-18]ODU22248.1 MAG: hypothetical protein ABS87_02540 [Sphingomonas sp. SCN 67-18]